MSSTPYDFGANGPDEPFWQRIHKFFTLPLDKAVLMRIGGLPRPASSPSPSSS